MKKQKIKNTAEILSKIESCSHIVYYNLFEDPQNPGLGGLDELTPDEELVVQSIAAGVYFVENEIPAGDINDINDTFTLTRTPNPATSLELKLNGAYLKAGGEDFTLVGLTITMVNPPPTGSLLLVSYRVSPV